ncbi:MAG TPA: class I SAM-dependent methyltransferase [Bacteroidia bacterium]|nr:class I SAM-dependent methyltransferase [Bacteroidia bacterium]
MNDFQLIDQKKCPVCDSDKKSLFLSCLDNTVSKKTFDLQECGVCGFVFTSPRPQNSDLGAFYESDEYISHSNTKKGIVSRLYQSVRNRTLKQKLQLIGSRQAKGQLLDIGCGTGEFLNAAQLDGWKVRGIEPGDKARQAAKENYNLDVQPEESLKQIAPESMDVITMWHVLEHVPDLAGRLQELKSILKKDGLLIVAVPNRNSHDAAHYGKHWAAYDVPRHLWHFRPQDIRALFAPHGFEVKEVLPMKFDSYYVSMLSEKYSTGAIRYFAAFRRGWISNSRAGKEAWSSQIYVLRKK